MFNRPTVSEDVENWLLNEFNWALDVGLLRQDTPLVTPEQKYFPAPKGTPDEIVAGLVGNILDVLGYGDDQITVVPIDRPNAEYRAAEAFQSTAEIAGGWSNHSGTSAIYFDPEMIDRPAVLLSTLVHEVMHHVLHKFPDAQADQDEEELRTDAHMITSGFGLIAIAGAESAGWQGYMRQPTRAHALAMFMALRDLEHEAVQGQFSRRMAKTLRRSIGQLATSGAMIPLKERLAA